MILSGLGAGTRERRPAAIFYYGLLPIHHPCVGRWSFQFRTCSSIDSDSTPTPFASFRSLPDGHRQPFVVCLRFVIRGWNTKFLLAWNNYNFVAVHLASTHSTKALPINIFLAQKESSWHQKIFQNRNLYQTESHDCKRYNFLRQNLQSFSAINHVI